MIPLGAAASAFGGVEADHRAVDPATGNVDAGDHGVTAYGTNRRPHCFAEAFLVIWQLPDRKRVDIDDAELFVGLDDSIANHPVLTARTARRVGAARPMVLSRATATQQADRQQGHRRITKHLHRRRRECQLRSPATTPAYLFPTPLGRIWLPLSDIDR